MQLEKTAIALTALANRMPEDECEEMVTDAAQMIAFLNKAYGLLLNTQSTNNSKPKSETPEAKPQQRRRPSLAELLSPQDSGPRARPSTAMASQRQQRSSGRKQRPLSSLGSCSAKRPLIGLQSRPSTALARTQRSGPPVEEASQEVNLCFL